MADAAAGAGRRDVPHLGRCGHVGEVESCLVECDGQPGVAGVGGGVDPARRAGEQRDARAGARAPEERGDVAGGVEDGGGARPRRAGVEGAREQPAVAGGGDDDLGRAGCAGDEGAGERVEGSGEPGCEQGPGDPRVLRCQYPSVASGCKAEGCIAECDGVETVYVVEGGGESRQGTSCPVPRQRAALENIANDGVCRKIN